MVKGIVVNKWVNTDVKCFENAFMFGEELKEAIKGLIENFLEPAGKNFVEELVFRFLLSLGGSMRNIGGFLAQRKLARSIISTLRVAGKSFEMLHAKTNTWMQMPQT